SAQREQSVHRTLLAASRPDPGPPERGNASWLRCYEKTGASSVFWICTTPARGRVAQRQTRLSTDSLTDFRRQSVRVADESEGGPRGHTCQQHQDSDAASHHSLLHVSWPSVVARAAQSSVVPRTSRNRQAPRCRAVLERIRAW